jgi:HD-GYP domain-containing protein (c-di-GMP phosphodiesterase class II)
MTRRELTSIHRRLFRRVLLASLVAAAAFAAVVIALSAQRISEIAADRAVQGLASFQQQLEIIAKQEGGLSPEAIQRCVDAAILHRPEFHYGQYIAIQITDAERKPLARYTDTGHPAAAAAETLVAKSASEPGADALIRRVIRLDGRHGVLVSVPLQIASVGFRAKATGVFAESEEERSRVRKQSLLTALAVAGLVLAVSALLYPIMRQLMGRVTAVSLDLLDSNLAMIQVLGSAIAKRDSDTDTHNCRVTICSVRLGEALHLGMDTMHTLIKGALLHDVGKIGVSDRILLKPGRLTEDEFAEMRKHVRYGSDIVGPVRWLSDAGDVVRYHHEKYDGSGYDSGLNSREIPLAARIFAIADVFDALTSRRPYKEPMAVLEALRILREGRGTHFDPNLLDTFEPIAESIYWEANESEEHARRSLETIMDRYFRSETSSKTN